MTDYEIILKHPRLFGEPPFNPRQTLIGFGFEVGKGWLPILEQLFDELEDVVEDDFKVLQVKEKFGSLNIHCNYTTDAIDKLIDKAEEKCAVTCDKCGAKGALRVDNGWYSVRCDECK